MMMQTVHLGSNMQRHCSINEVWRPYVGTGIEGRLARDSRVLVTANEAGKVAYVSANKVIITASGRCLKNEIKEQTYDLRKFMGSNAGTCLNQRPLVKLGQKVAVGDVIADGSGTDEGELALGKNVVVAFMPWSGYNFEDAILINQSIVREDVYTSIHIEEFECGARDTKLGPEEITRDIPNVGEEALKNLS